eukprot:353939-Chlamydomonas_euryale.AAC.2
MEDRVHVHAPGTRAAAAAAAAVAAALLLLLLRRARPIRTHSVCSYVKHFVRSTSVAAAIGAACLCCPTSCCLPACCPPACCPVVCCPAASCCCGCGSAWISVLRTAAAFLPAFAA